jgi:2-octaprenyl-6-methoxyphenol hydroxylase
MKLRSGCDMAKKAQNLSPRHVKVAVVGGGAIGLGVALGLKQAGVDVLLAGAPETVRDDGRTAALMQPSVAFLKRIGVHERLDGKGFPLAAMRLIDITGGLLRAPTVTFRASEIDLDAFAENFSNADIVRAMLARAGEDGLETTTALVSAATFEPERVLLTLADGSSLSADLVIAADGARSPLREAAGIGTKTWAYEQVALTFHVRHTRDHEDVSTEFHTRSGPLTFVPYGDYTSSVVWLVTPDEAEDLRGLDDRGLAIACQRRSSSLLGDLTLTGNRGAVPMRGMIANTATAPRLMLAGEALHVFPPVGAQGMNLGFRDAQGILDAVFEAETDGADFGGKTALDAYDRGRRIDATSRTLGVDLLNRSLIAGLLPLDLLRFAGLTAASHLSPLRRVLMRAGMGQSLAP